MSSARGTAGVGRNADRQGKKGQKQYSLPDDCYTTALNRIRWLWDEFDGNVAVSSSGGKDSTVVVNLALQVARERGTLPLTVRWLDQEAEFASTVAYQRQMADNPEIAFEWYQVPFRLFNAVNYSDQWLKVWDDDDPEHWMREKEPDSIHVNTLGTDRFEPLLVAMGERQSLMDPSDPKSPRRPACVLTGQRAAESPTRRLGLTSSLTYKWVTWGRKGPHHFVFHPIYDWTVGDVWKAIYDGGWSYNAAYDFQHRYGITPGKMRVSSLHHETSVPILFYLQEYEPETWDAITQRLDGINTAGRLGGDDFFVKELPFMFRDWREYHDYLVENLIHDPADRAKFYKNRDYCVKQMHGAASDPIHKELVKAVLVNDTWSTKAAQLVTRYNYVRKE